MFNFDLISQFFVESFNMLKNVLDTQALTNKESINHTWWELNGSGGNTIMLMGDFNVHALNVKLIIVSILFSRQSQSTET